MSKQEKGKSIDTPELSRRNFFKHGFTKVVDASVGILEQRAGQKARHWIRPPFAKPELDFLLACTRCNACVDACPHQVIFTLPVRRGAEVAATPALDILNKGCQLCSDWPCVNACGEDALSFSVLTAWQQPQCQELEANPISGTELESTMPGAIDCPPMAKATINTALCIPYSGPECGACRGTCPIDNTLTWQGDTPVINQQSCIGCGQCRDACITTPKAVEIQTLAPPLTEPSGT
jgi:ferredoxin-type protein NapG